MTINQISVSLIAYNVAEKIQTAVHSVLWADEIAEIMHAGNSVHANLCREGIYLKGGSRLVPHTGLMMQ